MKKSHQFINTKSVPSQKWDGFKKTPKQQFEIYDHIYPNPATNYINIQSESLIKTISILDFTGKEVANEKAHNKLYQLNTSKLKSGIYLLMIETEAAIYTERMIIE